MLDKFAQIRSVNHRMKNHNSAGYYSLTGHAPPLDDQPAARHAGALSRLWQHVARFRPADDPAVPSFVSYPYVIRDGSVTPGQTASFLGKAYDPFFISQDPAEPDFRLPELSLPASLPLGRLDDRRNLLRMIDEQGDLLAWSGHRPGDRPLLRPGPDHARLAQGEAGVRPHASEPAQAARRYGRSTYGQSCLLARRLIEAGVRFVNVYNSPGINGTHGWDTHGNNFKRLKDQLLPYTDQSVPTLIDDLDARGLLDETLVVWMGEFGRIAQDRSTPPSSAPTAATTGRIATRS